MSPAPAHSPRGDGVGRWAFGEVTRASGWNPHDGIRLLMKETPESMLVPSTVGTQRESAPVNQEVGALETRSLLPPGSRLVFVSHSVDGVFVIAAETV